MEKRGAWDRNDGADRAEGAKGQTSLEHKSSVPFHSWNGPNGLWSANTCKTHYCIVPSPLWHWFTQGMTAYYLNHWLKQQKLVCGAKGSNPSSELCWSQYDAIGWNFCFFTLLFI